MGVEQPGGSPPKQSAGSGLPHYSSAREAAAMVLPPELLGKNASELAAIEAALKPSEVVHFVVLAWQAPPGGATLPESHKGLLVVTDARLLFAEAMAGRVHVIELPLTSVRAVTFDRGGVLAHPMVILDLGLGESCWIAVSQGRQAAGDLDRVLRLLIGQQSLHRAPSCLPAIGGLVGLLVAVVCIVLLVGSLVVNMYRASHPIRELRGDLTVMARGFKLIDETLSASDPDAIVLERDSDGTTELVIEFRDQLRSVEERWAYDNAHIEASQPISRSFAASPPSRPVDWGDRLDAMGGGLINPEIRFLLPLEANTTHRLVSFKAVATVTWPRHFDPVHFTNESKVIERDFRVFFAESGDIELRSPPPAVPGSELLVLAAVGSVAAGLAFLTLRSRRASDESPV